MVELNQIQQLFLIIQKGVKKMSTEEKPTSNALRDTTFFFIAVSLLLQSVLWNYIQNELKITLEIALASFFYTGWVKKGLEITIGGYIISLRKKDIQLLDLEKTKNELEQKNKILDDLVLKLNSLLNSKYGPTNEVL